MQTNNNALKVIHLVAKMTARKATPFYPVIFDLFSPFVFDNIDQSPLWEDATFHSIGSMPLALCYTHILSSEFPGINLNCQMMVQSWSVEFCIGQNPFLYLL